MTEIDCHVLPHTVSCVVSLVITVKTSRTGLYQFEGNALHTQRGGRNPHREDNPTISLTLTIEDIDHWMFDPWQDWVHEDTHAGGTIKMPGLLKERDNLTIYSPKIACVYYDQWWLLRLKYHLPADSCEWQNDRANCARERTLTVCSRCGT